MGALEGIRVLDVGLLVQAPQAGLMLADLGADVIKVELPGIGDQARWVASSDTDSRSGYFIGLNRGKRSITIDLRTPEGADVFLRLAETADIVVSNFTPNTMEAWGVGYEQLAARNPGIIYGAGSVFGPTGPDADREGTDLAAQAAGGLLTTIGVDGEPLSPIGVTVADYTASQNMVVGVLAALHSRATSGLGQRVDVSLLGGQVYLQASEYTSYFLTGQQPGRANHGHPLINAAYFMLETANGYIVVVGVPLPAREAFYDAIGRPDLGADPRFAAVMYKSTDKQALRAELVDLFKTKTTEEWCDVLAPTGARYAPLRDYDAVMADPMVWENGYVIEIDHPEWGRMPMVGSPLTMSKTPTEPGHLAPELGANTEEVLLELGYGWDDIAALRESKAI